MEQQQWSCQPPHLGTHWGISGYICVIAAEIQMRTVALQYSGSCTKQALGGGGGSEGGGCGFCNENGILHGSV